LAEFVVAMKPVSSVTIFVIVTSDEAS